MITKVCCACGVEKPETEFHMKLARKNLRQTKCKSCTNAYSAQQYQKNRGQILADKKQYYVENGDTILENRREHYANNTENVKKRNYAYKKENHGYYIAKAKERELTKKNRTPAWADKARIQAYYDVCAFFNEANGYAKYHVDHIVPLQGKTVSGLHVHNNLQVIPAKENLSKGNRHESG